MPLLAPRLLPGQGCLRALFGEEYISIESGFKRGFCQWPEIGSGVGKVGFWVQKWADLGPILGHRQKPLLNPL